jgi:very-short-patch-repair endonuclease
VSETKNPKSFIYLPNYQNKFYDMEKERIYKFAGELRKNQTPAEKKLWEHIRNRKLSKCKFLRQHPIPYRNFNNKISYFIPDFYCVEKKLIIELDGKIHDFQKEYDNNREAILKDLNLRVLRFKNEELEDIYKVLDIIRKSL